MTHNFLIDQVYYGLYWQKYFVKETHGNANLLGSESIMVFSES